MRALTKSAILNVLQKFLPMGTAWPRALDSVLARLLAAFATPMALLDLRLQELLNELNPETSTELLAEWEAFVGSNDACCAASTTVITLDGRRRRVVSRLTEEGTLSKAYFLRVALDLGYSDTTITEFKPTHCEMHCESPVRSVLWRFAWEVNLPHSADNYTALRADGRADERIDSYAMGELECRFMSLKPAHTYVIFTYEGSAA